MNALSTIVITRISVCTALGNSLEETVAALRRNEVGIRTPCALEQTPRIDAGAGEVALCGEPRGAERAEILLATAIDNLLTREDHTAIACAPHRWGIALGTTLAGMRHCAAGVRAENDGRMTDAELAYARSCASSVLSSALRRCAITGPTMTVSCACASALTAVSHACTLLQAGEVDAVIAGGYDPISEFVYGGFSALQLVAAGPLSPFAKDREGMKLGEGAALFLLRRLVDLDEHERAHIRGVIEACAETSDAHHLTQPHPQGIGAARALSQVLEYDGAHKVKPPDLIVAHATGTAGNDSAEYEAYRAAVGSALATVPVVALKSRFGHPLGAAGVLELASVIGCAENDFIPSSIGRGRDAEAFPDLDLIEDATRDGSVQSIVVLSAGFGGANAALRVSRANEARLEVSTTLAPRVVADSTIRITAAGAVSSAGRGVAALRARAREGGIWPAFSEDTLTPLLDRTKSRRLALLPRLMIGAVRDLIESTNLTTDELRSTPLIAANWFGTADYTERYYRDLVRSGIDLANPMLFAESVPNIGSAQCSLAFGIDASTLSVIGRRTAALEAIMLASARIRLGTWTRAIVVAGEETHPIVERVLSRAIGASIELRSGAVAILLERAQPIASDETRSTRPTLLEIEHVLGVTCARSPGTAAAKLCRRLRVAPLDGQTGQTTNSPFDHPLLRCLGRPCDARFSRGFQRFPCIELAELGAATPLAALLVNNWSVADSVPSSTPRWLCSNDPHGASWAVLTRTGAIHNAS